MKEKEYDKLADQLKPKPQVLKNCIKAFLFGGAIGAIGQAILRFYCQLFQYSEKDATPMMIITMVLLAAILTGLGIYDRIAKHAGAGTFIPITGFSNSMTSSAMESRSEGPVLGIGANMFKLGGTVITFGIVSSFILGGIRYVIQYFG